MIDAYSDFETRSAIDIGDTGAWKYAAHPSTFPLMFAVLAGVEVFQWVRREHGDACPDWLRDVINDDDVVFHAWNCGFEIAVYNTVCRDRWNWPDIALRRWRDTAAKAAHANQPRALGNACKRLGVSERKDATGKQLISQLCMPQKTVKALKYTNTKGNQERGTVGNLRHDSVKYLEEHEVHVFEHKFPSKAKESVDGFIIADAYWNDDPDLMKRFEKYNRQDVYAERDVCHALPDFPDSEQRVWLLDHEVNARGIPIDRELCLAVQKVYAVETDICNTLLADECRDSVNDGPKAVVERHTQGDRIKGWINKRVDFALPARIAATYSIDHVDKEGNIKSSLRKEVVEEWIKNPWGVEHTPQVEIDRVMRALDLIQIAGGSGVKKYWAAMDFIENDDFARGQLLYYGAATGRWSGKGVQPHNFVRDGWFEAPNSTGSNRIAEDMFFDVINSGDHSFVHQVAELFGCTVNGLLRKQVRGLIKAPEGYQLIVSDFAGIEARVLQWLAGNTEVCTLFANPTWDNYVHTAAGIFDIAYDIMMEPDPDHPGGLRCKKGFKDKRQIGKIACFGADTEVLTDSGWKPIIQVALNDRLWDGVEWCKHDGAFNTGVRSVLDLQGLEVTPDHDIFIDNKKVKACQLNESIQLLKQGIDSARLRLPASFGGREVGSWATPVYAIAGENVGLIQLTCKLEKQHDARYVQRKQQQTPDQKQEVLELSCQTIDTDDGGLTGFLRWNLDVTMTETRLTTTTADGVLESTRLGFGIVLSFYDSFKQSLVGTTQHWRLTGLTTTILTSPEISEWSIEKEILQIPERLGKCGITVGATPPLNFIESFAHRINEHQQSVSIFEMEKNPKRSSIRVYDILNVGKRNRFTIRTPKGDPLIVSNCLALGYGMGWVKYQGTCEGFGVKVDDDFAKEIVAKWRASNPLVTALWKRVERAAKHVIKGKRNTTAQIDGMLRFAWDRRGYLTIQLPSGRKLFYYKARIDRETGQILYLDGGKSEGAYFVSTYGAKLVENIIQAASRDLLVHSAFLAHADGLRLIMHVHDELVALARLTDTTAYDRLHTHMSTIPTWATGLPLAAETYISCRYTK